MPALLHSEQLQSDSLEFGTRPVSLEQELRVSYLDRLCQPYVPLLRQVVSGQRFKAVFRLEPGFFHVGEAISDDLMIEDSTNYQHLFEPVTFQFFHGCLMGRIYYQGNGYAFPPLFRNEAGQLTWRLRSQGDMASQQEFFNLPPALLQFFFNLLKQTFLHEPVLCPAQVPVAHQHLNAVAWKIKS